MSIWHVDFYRRPLQDEAGHPLWELLIVSDRTQFPPAFCSQSAATAAWLTAQLQQSMQVSGEVPTALHAFRPATLALLTVAAPPLGIAVAPTRHAPALKQWLRERATQYPTLPNYTPQPYEPVTLEQPPPMPLPENLWGDQWRFAAIAAGNLESFIVNHPIPIQSVPSDRLPLALGLASTLPIPGVVIDGGRQAMRLARWLQPLPPVSLHYSPGAPDGLILDSGLVDRWVMATFTDEAVKTAAHLFKERQYNSQGLHFLLVQPDDSGMTYSGFWLLQVEQGK